MPFLVVPSASLSRAVKAAPFAFTGAKRTALTGGAGGEVQGFQEEGQDKVGNAVDAFVGTNWRVWINTQEGLIEGKMMDVVEGDYVAQAAAKPSIACSRGLADSAALEPLRAVTKSAFQPWKIVIVRKRKGDL